MPRQKTREELLDRIDELEAENGNLQDQVVWIADIIEPEENDDEGGKLEPGCGASWRKEDDQITDRRSRRRANECRPGLARSSNHLFVDMAFFLACLHDFTKGRIENLEIEIGYRMTFVYGLTKCDGTTRNVVD